MFSSFIISSLALLVCAEASQRILTVQPDPGLCNIYEKDALLNTAHIYGFLDSGSYHKAPSEKTSANPKPKPRKIYDKWTTKPSCVTDEEGQDFCVYTNSQFANGRGISFFTTPSIASKILELPAFTSPEIHDSANIFSDPPWEVRHIPGRGNGLFATKKLERGDLILANTPLGVYNSDAFFADYGLGYQYLRKTFDQLPKKSQELFLRTGVHSPGDPVMERINTNAFAGEFQGSNHFLLYPETALMNHDCRPNAMYYHNTSTLIHSTHASRTINPGEEITITYINLLQSRAERQENLNMMWGFTCTCELCSRKDVDRRRSDRNMKKIIQLHTDLADWTSTSKATPKMAEKLLKIYNEEHLHAAIGTGHMFAAYAYNALGNTEMAVKHAEKAIKAGMVSSGSAAADEREMRALLESSIGHWSYMRRARVG